MTIDEYKAALQAVDTDDVRIWAESFCHSDDTPMIVALCDIADHAAELLERLERCKEALEWYADGGNYPPVPGSIEWHREKRMPQRKTLSPFERRLLKQRIREYMRKTKCPECGAYFTCNH